MGAVYQLHQEGFILVDRNGEREVLLTKEQVDWLLEHLDTAEHSWNKFVEVFHLPRYKRKKKLAQKKRFYIMVFKEILGTRQIRVQDVRMTYKLLGHTIGTKFIRQTLKQMKYTRNLYGFIREKNPRKKHRIFSPRSFNHLDEPLFE